MGVFKNYVIKACRKYNCKLTLFETAFIYTNIAQCSKTRSQCPSLLFLLNFINLLLKFQMYQSSADFSGLFRLKGKSGKNFISSYLQDLCLKVLVLLGFGGCSQASPPTPSLGAILPLGLSFSVFRAILAFSNQP